ncbi:MAG: trypsin-like peptidase domain-containing protein [Thermoguttaceae bacterium]
MTFRKIPVFFLILVAAVASSKVQGAVQEERHAPDVDIQAQVDETAFVQAQAISVAFRQASKRALPGTVKIVVRNGVKELNSARSKLPFADLLPDIPDKSLIEGGGSGFIVDPSGIVVTNNHVVASSDLGKTISVELNDGRRFDAKKIVKDERADVAIVMIESPEPLPYLTFADSDSVNIGDWALAIGNPFMLGSSVSAGVVSAKERFIEKDAKLFIQTDAAVNPGNSGGPLVNLRGEVVGVNTAIASSNGAYQGIGFAIPSNIAQWAYRQLVEKGKVERAFLGAEISALSYEESKRIGVQPQTGVRIGPPFKDSPAAKAGLRNNDVILELDGKKAESPELFSAMVERVDVTIDHTLKILRDSTTEPVDVAIRFEIKPDNYVGVPMTGKMVEKGAHHIDRNWGMMLILPTSESLARLGVGDVQGLIVLNATPGGLAYRAGVRSGALIAKVGGRAVTSFEEYEAAKDDANAEEEVEVEFILKKETKTIKLPAK